MLAKSRIAFLLSTLLVLLTESLASRIPDHCDYPPCRPPHIDKRRQPQVVHDPCFAKGHWVEFDFSRCANADDLTPIITSQDEDTRLVATMGQSKICVQPMKFSGRAFLESASHQDWTDSSMQYVNFSFPEYTNDKDVNKATYVRSKTGKDGEAELHTAATFSSGRFYSTPDEVAPLDEDSMPGYTVNGTKFYDGLKLTWCEEEGEGGEV